MNIAIIGGGLAGLTAAAYLVRAGQTVTVFEKSHQLGGRARTEIKQGFAFNLGAHALYRKGPAARILRELGVEFSGNLAGTDNAYAIDNGTKHTLPGGITSLLTTSLLSLPAKLEAAKLLANLPKIDAAAQDHLTVREWLDQAVKHLKVNQLVQSLFRVSTYANDPERQSAGAAIRQLQMGLDGGVYYLDNGWQMLVNGLRTVAEQAGAKILPEANVAALTRHAQGFTVQLANGTNHHADSVILAVNPTEAATLVKDNAALVECANTTIPVRAACLDVALTNLPQPYARFALGIDQPYYFSVHSATANLAPNNGAMIHLMKYLPTNSEADATPIEQELEHVLEMMQPGWRTKLKERRFLPRMTVTNALVTAAQGGLTGRINPAVPGIDGLYVAGDWVGAEGQLADGSLASAKAAAEMIVQRQTHHATATV